MSNKQEETKQLKEEITNYLSALSEIIHETAPDEIKKQWIQENNTSYVKSNKKIINLYSNIEEASKKEMETYFNQECSRIFSSPDEELFQIITSESGLNITKEKAKELKKLSNIKDEIKEMQDQLISKINDKRTTDINFHNILKNVANHVKLEAYETFISFIDHIKEHDSKYYDFINKTMSEVDNDEKRLEFLITEIQNNGMNKKISFENKDNVFKINFDGATSGLPDITTFALDEEMNIKCMITEVTLSASARFENGQLAYHKEKIVKFNEDLRAVLKKDNILESLKEEMLKKDPEISNTQILGKLFEYINQYLNKNKSKENSVLFDKINFTDPLIEEIVASYKSLNKKNTNNLALLNKIVKHKDEDQDQIESALLRKNITVKSVAPNKSIRLFKLEQSFKDQEEPKTKQEEKKVLSKKNSKIKLIESLALNVGDEILDIFSAYIYNIAVQSKLYEDNYDKLGENEKVNIEEYKNITSLIESNLESSYVLYNTKTKDKAGEYIYINKTVYISDHIKEIKIIEEKFLKTLSTNTEIRNLFLSNESKRENDELYLMMKYFENSTNDNNSKSAKEIYNKYINKEPGFIKDKKMEEKDKKMEEKDKKAINKMISANMTINDIIGEQDYEEEIVVVLFIKSLIIEKDTEVKDDKLFAFAKWIKENNKIETLKEIISMLEQEELKSIAQIINNSKIDKSFFNTFLEVIKKMKEEGVAINKDSVEERIRRM